MNRPTVSRDCGAVLITVLMIVAIMSSVLVVMLDDMRFVLKQEANRQLRSQAYWYAIGAEALATTSLEQSWRQRTGRHDQREVWVQTPFVLPIEGGRILARLSDASNCFNLNSVVEPIDQSRWQRNEHGVFLYQRLLEALDFAEADQIALANALVDWIDSDGAPSSAGGEDNLYGRNIPAYRTGNTLLASVGELRAVSGYDPVVMARLRDYVCVHPTHEASRLNPNILRPEKAALIQMLTGPQVRLTEIISLLETRSEDGFVNVADFWARPAFAGLAIADQTKVLISMRSAYFDLTTRVVYENASFDLTSRFAMSATGQVDLEWRRYGDTS